MTEKKFGPNEMQQQMEQYDAMMSNLAPIAGTYYKSLIENGIPDDLACHLVMNWHSLWWEGVMGFNRDD